MMKFLIIFTILFFVGCGIYPTDNIVITKKEKNGNWCNYTVTAPSVSWLGNLALKNYPCDCFDIGDTLDIILIGKANNEVD